MTHSTIALSVTIALTLVIVAIVALPIDSEIGDPGREVNQSGDCPFTDLVLDPGYGVTRMAREPSCAGNAATAKPAGIAIE